jgi:hypothetical protein
MPSSPTTSRLVNGNRRPDDRIPDYLHWKRRERWPAPAATCLLLDICPEGLLGRGFAQCWHSDSHSVDRVRQRFNPWEVALFNEARRVAEYVRDALQTCTLSHDLYPPVFDALHPPTFLLWARDKEFDIPPGISDLIANSRSRQELQAEVDRMSAELAAALQVGRGTSASAETQRIRTLQRMVLAMAQAKYKWTPTGRNVATGEKTGSIAAEVVAHLGEQRSLSADAIREALLQAADEFPGKAD